MLFSLTFGLMCFVVHRKCLYLKFVLNVKYLFILMTQPFDIVEEIKASVSNMCGLEVFHLVYKQVAAVSNRDF